jgi:hypothetical protein
MTSAPCPYAPVFGKRHPEDLLQPSCAPLCPVFLRVTSRALTFILLIVTNIVFRREYAVGRDPLQFNNSKITNTSSRMQMLRRFRIGEFKRYVAGWQAM